MKLSIIICTFNRSFELEQLLEDICSQHKKLESQKDIEIILVDNNSFDNTAEVVYRFVENTELSIKYFTEKKLGLSACRNFAVTKASGDLLAFIHDDINLDEDWLKEAYQLALSCHDQEIGVFGGRSVPMWQEDFPDWLNLQKPYGVRQEVFSGHSFGDEEQYYPFDTEYGTAEFPSGINVFIRKEIFENCGNFRTDLGPSAAGGFSVLDDYEFFEYLSMLKIPMVYVPQCIVYHPVSPSKMTIQNIRRWYFKNGRAQYWIAHTDRMKREPHPLLGINPKFRKIIPAFAKQKFKGVPIFLHMKFFFLTFEWLLQHFSLNSARRHWLSFRISETMGEIEASALVNEQVNSRKFSFKDRLIKKGITADFN